MACGGCLRRGLLLAELAPNIDRAVDRAAGSRARDLLALGNRELAVAVRGEAAAAEAVLERIATPVAAGALAARLERSGCWAVCAHDRDWPAGFERLGGAAPRALFGRGERSLLASIRERPAVTVVGARRASAYGREVAETLGFELSAAGLPVISGMAFGIDSSVHRGALRGGETVAVLGSGPERAYPRSFARLHREICERGLAISELPPGAPTFRWTFPARNRLMAALAEMTVVVEAAERSGSLITAEMAADCGRAVGAVPGPVNSWRSAGANLLLRDGACVVRDAADVLEQLFGVGAEALASKPAACPPDLQPVLDAVEGGARTIDTVVVACGLPFAEVAAKLAALELEGHLVSALDGSYARAARRTPQP